MVWTLLYQDWLKDSHFLLEQLFTADVIGVNKDVNEEKGVQEWIIFNNVHQTGLVFVFCDKWGSSSTTLILLKVTWVNWVSLSPALKFLQLSKKSAWRSCKVSTRSEAIDQIIKQRSLNNHAKQQNISLSSKVQSISPLHFLDEFRPNIRCVLNTQYTIYLYIKTFFSRNIQN